jgi:hypothetical protein
MVFRMQAKSLSYITIQCRIAYMMVMLGQLNEAMHKL